MHLNAIDAYSMYLFHNGTNYNSYRLFGAHKAVRRKESCVRFAVWAPHAQAVSVVGDFNGWDDSRNPMERADENGIWKTFIPGIREGAVYQDRCGRYDPEGRPLCLPGGGPPQYGFRGGVPELQMA